MKGIKTWVAFVAVCLVGLFVFYPRFAFGQETPKVIKVIDKTNVEEEKEFLPEALYWQIKNWDYKMKVIEPIRDLHFPKALQELTEKYKGQVKIDAEGNMVNWKGGVLFPEPKKETKS
jgi:hypothetical protein